MQFFENCKGIGSVEGGLKARGTYLSIMDKISRVCRKVQAGKRQRDAKELGWF